MSLAVAAVVGADTPPGLAALTAAAHTIRLVAAELPQGVSMTAPHRNAAAAGTLDEAWAGERAWLAEACACAPDHTMSSRPVITAAELGRHNRREDAWLAIDGVVYDVTMRHAVLAAPPRRHFDAAPASWGTHQKYSRRCMRRAAAPQWTTATSSSLASQSASSSPANDCPSRVKTQKSPFYFATLGRRLPFFLTLAPPLP